MASSSKLLVVELTFRVQRRLDYTTELNMAIESEDEIEMMRIAKKIKRWKVSVFRWTKYWHWLLKSWKPFELQRNVIWNKNYVLIPVKELAKHFL